MVVVVEELVAVLHVKLELMVVLVEVEAVLQLQLMWLGQEILLQQVHHKEIMVELETEQNQVPKIEVVVAVEVQVAQVLLQLQHKKEMVEMHLMLGQEIVQQELVVAAVVDKVQLHQLEVVAVVLELLDQLEHKMELIIQAVAVVVQEMALLDLVDQV
jgi:hypothetical protein